jgi:broad specificity phosphatase PhoE
MSEPDSLRNLYLIRHSLSENNEAKKYLYGMDFGSMEWRHVKSILTVDMNSPICVKGKELCQSQREKLKDFLSLNEIDSIYYSPYIRAKETCELLFPSHLDDANMKIKRQEQELLKEQLLSEYFGIHNIESRVNMFKQWLVAQEESRNVILVGHSKFFRCLLKSDIHMKNCEVFHCFMDKSMAIHTGKGIIVPGGEGSGE